MAAENTERFSRIFLSNGGLATGDQKPNEAFLNWRAASLGMRTFDLRRIIQSGTKRILTEEELDAYDAPFPDESYKEGGRILPSLVPISPDDPESERNRAANQVFMKWEKPFITAFGDSDPVTAGADKLYQQIVPGAKNQNHTTIKNAHHFVQEDAGPELGKLIVQFIKDNPL
jgi:haloalkane dehalogenase